MQIPARKKTVKVFLCETYVAELVNMRETPHFSLLVFQIFISFDTLIRPGF